MRLAAAIAVIAVAWAGAVYLHQHQFKETVKTPCGLVDPLLRRCGKGDKFQVSSHPVHPSWKDPATVLIAVGGVAVAAGIATSRRRPRLA